MTFDDDIQYVKIEKHPGGQWWCWLCKIHPTTGRAEHFDYLGATHDEACLGASALARAHAWPKPEFTITINL